MEKMLNEILGEILGAKVVSLDEARESKKAKEAKKEVVSEGDVLAGIFKSLEKDLIRHLSIEEKVEYFGMKVKALDEELKSELSKLMQDSPSVDSIELIISLNGGIAGTTLIIEEFERLFK